MAIDTTAPRSRRALLASVGAAVAGAAAATLGRALPAAAEGQNVQVGGEYTDATSTTLIENQANDETIFEARSLGGGTAIVGQSDSGGGISGVSNTGEGVVAWCPQGLALRVQRGRIRVDEVSGVATIPAGSRAATVQLGHDVNDRTFVLLTPMSNIGARSLWFTKNASADRFTIRMSSTRGRSTKVAWLAIERGDA